jgi:sec-independent protein translocase protein TatA
MGLGGISIWQLLIILAIVVMLFGTSRLRNMGWRFGQCYQRLSQQHEQRRERQRR